jgi:hypothetical protein
VIVLNNTFDVTQVAFSKSAFAFYLDWVKPELRFISAFVYVNVRRFIGYLLDRKRICNGLRAGRQAWELRWMKDENIIALPSQQNLKLVKR